MVASRAAEGLNIHCGEVRHGVSLQVTPNHLDRIEVGGIGRERFAVQGTSAREESIDYLGPMRVRAIPDDDHRLLEVPAQIPDETDNAVGRDVGVGEQGKVKSYPPSVWCDGQGGYGGHFLMRASTLDEDRRPSSRRPGPSNDRRHHEAALVDKDDVGVQAAGFFLIRGHSVRIQRWTTLPSRSRACLSGFWGLHPIERKSLPI